jgi:hypothetical protein
MIFVWAALGSIERVAGWISGNTGGSFSAAFEKIQKGYGRIPVLGSETFQNWSGIAAAVALVGFVILWVIDRWMPATNAAAASPSKKKGNKQKAKPRSRKPKIGKQTSQPSNAPQSLVASFVGRWQMVAVPTSSAFVMTLESSFGCQRSDGARGTWEIVGNEARMTWADGWKDILRLQPDGSALKTAFAPGTDWTGEPHNRQPANKLA